MVGDHEGFAPPQKVGHQLQQRLRAFQSHGVAGVVHISDVAVGDAFLIDGGRFGVQQPILLSEYRQRGALDPFQMPLQVAVVDGAQVHQQQILMPVLRYDGGSVRVGEQSRGRPAVGGHYRHRGNQDQRLYPFRFLGGVPGGQGGADGQAHQRAAFRILADGGGDGIPAPLAKAQFPHPAAPGRQLVGQRRAPGQPVNDDHGLARFRFRSAHGSRSPFIRFI